MENRSEVWAGDCLFDVTNIQMISYDPLANSGSVLDNYMSGDPIHPDDLPKRCFKNKHKKVPKLKDVSQIQSGMLMISARFAELLREFDLGAPVELGPDHRRVEMHPIAFYETDKTTHVGDYVLVHVTVQKDCFAPEHSSKLGGGPDIWVPMGLESIAVREAALGGPDLWRAPGLWNVLFFSDRLKRAIEAAKIEPITFHSCQIVD